MKRNIKVNSDNIVEESNISDVICSLFNDDVLKKHQHKSKTLLRHDIIERLTILNLSKKQLISLLELIKNL